MYDERCDHMVEGPPPEPNTSGCEECQKLGQTWVHLRICRTCGHVGCCDSSTGKHATEHFRETGHPVMQSFEPGEDWGWCYIDEKKLGPFPPARG
jgi:uncharacterized UBP type Zn finger protein